MKSINKLMLWLIVVQLFTSCDEVNFPASKLSGTWKQVAVLEDGVEDPAQANSCYLLFEPNGICRFSHNTFTQYAGSPTSFYGTWSILDDTWLNISTDKWQLIASVTTDSAKVNLSYKKNALNQTVIDTTTSVLKQWSKYHIQSRFTILKLSDNELEIRLKTFVGEKKYALLFAPAAADFVELKVEPGKVNYSPKLITDDNYWTTQKEFRTLKTYIYRFRKESN